MNKLKSLFAIVLAIGFLASCGVDDLENRIEKIEDGLGYSEPIKVKFSTTDNNDKTVKEDGPFILKGAYMSGVIDYGGGHYYIWVQRFTNLEYNGSGQNAYIDFHYDANTEGVSDAEIELSIYQTSGQWLYPEFYQDGGDDMTFNLEVTNFNAETGAVNVRFSGSTTEDYGGNVYEGKPMTISGSFKGELKFVEGEL